MEDQAVSNRVSLRTASTRTNVVDHGQLVVNVQGILPIWDVTVWPAVVFALQRPTISRAVSAFSVLWEYGIIPHFTAVCSNRHRNCARMARSGECQSKASWMFENCRRACKMCRQTPRCWSSGKLFLEDSTIQLHAYPSFPFLAVAKNTLHW